MFAEYMATLQESDLNFNIRGRYADTVFQFLIDADSVSRRGYKVYMKQNAEMAVDKPWTKNALCHFLASRGMGYNGRQVTSKLEKPESAAMEKREVRQRQIINDFVLWLENEFDFSPHTMKTYTDTARQFFSYCDEFSQDNARRFIATLEANGLKPATINLRMSGLEKLAEYLKKPCKLKRPKTQKTLSVENVPTEKEYNTLLAWLDQHNEHWAFVVRLMGTTGCRVSELVQFTYDMVSEGHCTLKGKGSKYRQFFFTKEDLREPLRRTHIDTRHSHSAEDLRRQIGSAEGKDTPPRLPSLLCKDVSEENKRRCFTGRHPRTWQRRYYTNLFTKDSR